MATAVHRWQLHELLSAALAAMPTSYGDREIKIGDDDAWHEAVQVTDGDGVAWLPAHNVHMGFAVEFDRGTRTGTAQRLGSDARAEVGGTLYLVFQLRPHAHESEDYRTAMAGAELAAHTLEGGWHGGLATVDIDEDWRPRRPDGEPYLITTISFRLRHDRSV